MSKKATSSGDSLGRVGGVSGTLGEFVFLRHLGRAKYGELESIVIDIGLRWWLWSSVETVRSLRRLWLNEMHFNKTTNLYPV